MGILLLTSSKLDLFGFFSDTNDEDVEADRLRDEFVDERELLLLVRSC